MRVRVNANLHCGKCLSLWALRFVVVLCGDPIAGRLLGVHNVSKFNKLDTDYL
jgi:hypothetical protein